MFKIGRMCLFSSLGKTLKMSARQPATPGQEAEVPPKVPT